MRYHPSCQGLVTQQRVQTASASVGSSGVEKLSPIVLCMKYFLLSGFSSQCGLKRPSSENDFVADILRCGYCIAMKHEVSE